MIGLVYWGLTPQQQPGSYQGGEMMMMNQFSGGDMDFLKVSKYRFLMKSTFMRSKEDELAVWYVLWQWLLPTYLVSEGYCRSTNEK